MRFTIRQWRGIRGWSQETLAQKAGVSRVNVANWESGKYLPRGKNLVSLAKALEVGIEDIILPVD